MQLFKNDFARHLFILIAGCAVVLVGVWLNTRSDLPKYGMTLDHVTAGNVGEYSALSIIAQQRGYFKEYGLDVTMKEYASGPPAVADVLAGKIDVATAADYVGVISSFNSQNLKILATQLRADSFYMAARRDHGIQAPADLTGKRVGVTPDTAGEYYLGEFLILNHLSFQDVTVIHETPDVLATMLEKGQLDAIVSFDPHIYDVQTKLGPNVLVWSVQGDERLSSLLYGSSKFVTTRPQAVQRYLQALLAAQTYMQEHNQDAEQIVGNYLGYSTAYTQRIWPRLSPDVSLDEYLLITLEEEARWAVDNGETNASYIPNYLRIIYFNGLEAVDPNAVTIIH